MAAKDYKTLFRIENLSLEKRVYMFNQFNDF